MVRTSGIFPLGSAGIIILMPAVATGYGGFTVEHGPHVVHGQWSQEEASKSSTWREP